MKEKWEKKNIEVNKRRGGWGRGGGRGRGEKKRRVRGKRKDINESLEEKKVSKLEEEDKKRTDMKRGGREVKNQQWRERKK